MAEINSENSIVCSFPPPPPYYHLFDSDNMEVEIKPPPCIQGNFTCFGTQLSSEISILPLDSDTLIYDQSNEDLCGELGKLNNEFQIGVLSLLENSGNGVLDPSYIKKVVKIYININHVLEKLRFIQAYYQIHDELEKQVNEKLEFIVKMKELLTQYKNLEENKSE
ncbi:hypothetical protein FG386_002962 [Cryptosporidium ryanae]|uniref:uncharacterized protein n=1 Tax=Cryptosporidium ryanae TaxID=515981 RepID=UPI00351A52B9|nr:hypothetical protein FG386_002962 [Cryptosporidium ryanae]